MAQFNEEPLMKQYSLSVDTLLRCYDECLEFGHGRIQITSKKQANGKREVHLEFGKDYKFLIGEEELNHITASAVEELEGNR